MSSNALLRIWRTIRDELALLQDQAPPELQGSVVNPISGLVYSQNTSCAALVFATEYVRSANPAWLSRTHLALDSVRREDIFLGLDEPKWNRLGWHLDRGSLFATGTAIDTYWKTLDLLDLHDERENLLRLLRYLETCLIRPGQFAHDSIKPGRRPPAVQNITAIALYLMEEAAERVGPVDNVLLKDRDTAEHVLLNGQRQDGFWPYVYPGAMQKFAYQHQLIGKGLRRLPMVRRPFFKAGDISIYFGDAVHHCLVLYYLAKATALREPSDPCREAIATGWEWVCKHIVRTSYNGLRFDFDWEPTPDFPRYCNFRDTSTYFLIIASLPFLATLGIVGSEHHAISSGLLAHIENSLLEPGGTYPTIAAYEGTPEILRFILPRVGEASAWKGALLADYILEHGADSERD